MRRVLIVEWHLLLCLQSNLVILIGIKHYNINSNYTMVSKKIHKARHVHVSKETTECLKFIINHFISHDCVMLISKKIDGNLL